MSVKKYRMAIIISILTVMLFLPIIINPPLKGGGAWESELKLMPGISHAGTIIGFSYFFSIIGAFGGIFIGCILGPLFLYFHKKIIGRKMEYGIIDKPQPNKFNSYFKGFFPALMAIEFGFVVALNPIILDILYYNWSIIEAEEKQILTMIILLPITIGMGFALFSSVWFLNDAGIVYSNKQKVKNKKEPPEVRNVGEWYNYILKGYAGISIIITLYDLVFTELASFSIYGQEPLLLMVTLPLPIYLSIFSLPAVVLFDITTKHREKFMRNFAKKLGIVDFIEISIEKIP